MKLSEAIKILNEVIPPPHNKMVDSDHMKIAIAWRELKNIFSAQEERLQGVYKWFGEAFESPCNYGFCGEDVKDFIDAHAPDWCEENCDNEDLAHCWQKYFELKLREGLA